MARPKNARDFFEVFRLRPPTDKGKEAPPRPDKEAEVNPMASDRPEDKREESQQAAPPPAPEPVVSAPAPPAPEPAPPAEDDRTAPEKQGPAPSWVGASPFRPVFLTEPGRVVITLGNQAFVAAVLILLLLLVLAFAAGNWRRKATGAAAPGNQTLTSEVERAAPPAPVVIKKGRETGIVRKEVAQYGATAPKTTHEPKPLSRPAPTSGPAPTVIAPRPPEPTATTPYWTLRVISGINANAAEKLRADLEKQGYPNITVKGEGRYSTLFMGKFEARESSEAKQFKKAVSELKVDGKIQFKDCYFVKVE